MGQAEDGGTTASALASGTMGGMIRGMTSAKVAISLPKEVLARARAAVRRGEAASLSAYVSKAIEEKTTDDDLMKMLDEMLEESGGPATPAERRWLDRVFERKSSRGRGTRK
jgi:Arc/MetJ-type ribon-helix-helix transcriptional regulator